MTNRKAEKTMTKRKDRQYNEQKEKKTKQRKKKKTEKTMNNRKDRQYNDQQKRQTKQ
jgi:hypothetical protein